jgi:hypothetical protein
MQWMATGVLTFVAVLLMFGGTIERMLEMASWAMLVFIFGFLVLVNVIFVPFSHTIETLQGFLVPQTVGQQIDWALFGALVGTAASGGIGNLTITNWIRDKGWGMGAKVGAIESAVGGRHTKLSPIGAVFPVTSENLRRWHAWWRYVHLDQVTIWAVFCFVGLFLNVNLATSLAPSGTNLQGLAAGTYQAQYMAEHLWAGFWVLTLLNGFWILFSTCLGNTDIFVRTVTDITWTGSATMRRLTGERPARIYYALLAIVTLWSFYAVRLAGPFAMFQVFANVAGLILAIAGVQIFRVNRRFLPVALRPPLWREVALIGCTVFYSFFAVRAMWSYL